MNSRVGPWYYTATYFLMNYVLNPYLEEGTVHSSRNPQDIEDKTVLLMNHDTGEMT